MVERLYSFLLIVVFVEFSETIIFYISNNAVVSENVCS